MVTKLHFSRNEGKISKAGKPYIARLYFGKCSFCNGVKEYTYSNLKWCRQTSCGCKKQKIVFGTQSIQRQFHNSMKISSQKRNRICDLSQEEAVKLAEQACFYCGEIASTLRHNARSKKGLYPAWVMNGIDRLDSKIGYTLGNVVSCCKECNRMKNDTSVPIFVAKIKRLYAKMCEKGLQ